MTVPQLSIDLSPYSDYGIVFLRLMAGLVFVTSGYTDLKTPAIRSKSIAASKGFTMFLGAAELLGGIAIIAGFLTQLAGAGLILIMLGALQKKIFVWKTGFWGETGLGWNYELLLTSMLTVIIFSDGGRFVLCR